MHATLHRGGTGLMRTRADATLYKSIASDTIASEEFGHVASRGIETQRSNIQIKEEWPTLANPN